MKCKCMRYISGTIAGLSYNVQLGNSEILTMDIRANLLVYKLAWTKHPNGTTFILSKIKYKPLYKLIIVILSRSLN